MRRPGTPAGSSTGRVPEFITLRAEAAANRLAWLRAEWEASLVGPVGVRPRSRSPAAPAIAAWNLRAAATARWRCGALSTPGPGGGGLAC